jgi:hypothetical protein
MPLCVERQWNLPLMSRRQAQAAYGNSLLSKDSAIASITANYARALNNLGYASGYPARQVRRIEQPEEFGCRTPMTQLDLRGRGELPVNDHDGQIYSSGMAVSPLG